MCMHVYIYIHIYIDLIIYIMQMNNIYILVAPRFKNLLRLEAGYPALRCHNLEEGPHPPLSDLKKYRRLGRRGLSEMNLSEVFWLRQAKGPQLANHEQAPHETEK